MKNEKEMKPVFLIQLNLWCKIGNAIHDTLRNYTDTCPGSNHIRIDSGHYVIVYLGFSIV